MNRVVDRCFGTQSLLLLILVCKKLQDFMMAKESATFKIKDIDLTLEEREKSYNILNRFKEDMGYKWEELRMETKSGIWRCV